MKTKTIKLKCPRCSHRIPVAVSEQAQRLSCPRCELLFELRFEDSTPLIRLVSRAPESSESPAAGSRSNPSEQSALSDHEYIRVKHWRETRGQMLSPREEKLQVLGLFFAVIGIACAAFPWFAAPLGVGPRTLFLIGTWGLIAMAISAIFLLYTMRHQSARSLLLAGLLLLIGGGLNGWTAQRYYGDVMARRVEADEPETEPEVVEANPLEGRPVRIDPLANPAARYVPPRRRDSTESSPNAPSAFFEVDNPVQNDRPGSDQAAVSPEHGNNSDNASEPFRPDMARPPINIEELERRTRDNPFGESGEPSEAPFSAKPTLPSGEFSPHEKQQRIADRTSRMRQIRVAKARVTDENFQNRFVVTKPIGKATVVGRGYYTEMAARGLDALKSERDKSAIAMVVPFYENAEFPDSLYKSGTHFLAGINAHFRDGQLVGIQAILAPPKNDRLDMEKTVNSIWFGEAGRGSRVQSITSPQGSPIHGIVVYEEKLKIVGLALIVDREAVDN